VPDEHQQTTPPDQLTQAPSPAEDAPGAAAQERAEARRKREQWERDHAQWLRERDETRREMFTLFKIWTICPHKNCERARACAVDTEECRRERWRHVVTDEIRFTIPRMAELSREGHPAREAYRMVRAEWQAKQKAWAEMDARLAAQRPTALTDAADASAPDRPPAPDSVPDDRAPRIRSL